MRFTYTAAMILIMFAIALCVVGCATPEPQVITKEVKVAVPVPCNPVLPARPQLLTREQVKVAIEGAATLDDRLKIISGQLLLYIGWVPVIEAGLAGCKGTESGNR